MPPITDLLAADRRDLLDVVLLGHGPDLAGASATEDAHRLRVAIGDPGEQKARVPPARAGGQVVPLDEHRVDAGLGEVVHQADPRDAAPDDQHIGAIGQPARIALGRPRPERNARAHEPSGAHKTVGEVTA